MKIEVGKKYHLIGMIENGFTTDENGNRVTRYTKENVTRVVRCVLPDGKVRCECGRVFLPEGLEAVELVNMSW